MKPASTSLAFATERAYRARMTTIEIGKKLVELCTAGKNEEAMTSLYSNDVVSVEAHAPPGQSAETAGLAGVLAKSKWWADNHTVHSAKVEGPWPQGDRFVVRFTYDITMKQSGTRAVMDEAAVYTVKGDKIVREEFFYNTGA